MPQKVAIESWDPDYGVPSTEQAEETDVEIDVDVEIPEKRWAPVPAQAEQRPEALLFIDGVRRVDANAWLEDGHSPVRQGSLPRSRPVPCAWPIRRTWIA